MDDKEVRQIEMIKDQLNAIPVGRKAGRPRKYRAEYIDFQAQKLNEWLDKKSTDELFWLKEYCLESGHSYAQCSNFAELSIPYKKAFDRLKTMQEVAILKWGSKKGNSFAYAIFTLKSVCGYRDGNNEKSEPKPKAGTYSDQVGNDD